jgi:carboxylesterase type B
VKILNQIIAANTPYNEDCLKLNIWTKPQTGEAKKAVLLWVYGGSFLQGATNNSIYSGQFLADKQDVVVVNFNYRTNIFGFPGAPNVGNLGLLDQRMAVQWVRDNIASFGGDPTRITLFGQSAGGASLDYYSLAWYNNDPIINGFIQQSGNVVQLGPLLPAVAQYNWNQVTSDLGCGDSSADQSQVIACMRGSGITIQQILNSAAKKDVKFTPIADGVTAFGDSGARIADGRFIKKPWLIGSTNGEGGFVNTLFQAKNGFALPQAVIDLGTLAIFTCPSRIAAQYRLQNNVPVW